ncbi:LysR family transcriptional regulator [Acidithiobacillus ferriphilus]
MPVCAVVRQNFKDAAGGLHTSQAGVSKQIQLLEVETHVELSCVGTNE